MYIGPHLREMICLGLHLAEILFVGCGTHIHCTYNCRLEKHIIWHALKSIELNYKLSFFFVVVSVNGKIADFQIFHDLCLSNVMTSATDYTAILLIFNDTFDQRYALHFKKCSQMTIDWPLSKASPLDLHIFDICPHNFMHTFSLLSNSMIYKPGTFI